MKKVFVGQEKTPRKEHNKVLKPLSIAHADPVTKGVAINTNFYFKIKSKQLYRRVDMDWPKEFTIKEKKDFLKKGESLMKKLYPGVILDL